VGKKQFLIDVGPDFRMQALHYGIRHLDGILLTHSHYDHIAGIDDLRALRFSGQERIPCLASHESFKEIKHFFHYLFEGYGGPRLPLDFTFLEDDFGKVKFEGLVVDFVSYTQANMKVNGYRLGSFAYISDIRKYDERVVVALQGVDLLVLSALRYTTSEVHFSLDEAIEFSRKVGAKRTFFTHIAHDLDHEETNAKLPPEAQLAHDGMEIEFEL